MVTIIDYGVGNLDSIQRGFQRVGIDTIISKSPETIKNATALILPGVGAFKNAMKALEESGLIPIIKEHLKKKTYFLCICLGLQLLYDKSYENGEHGGLGIIKGSIERFDSNLKVPHMGWNRLNFKKQDPILNYIKNGDYVYFVHSYYVNSSNEELIASTDYGVKVPAIVRKNNVYATQFHPEKSGVVGLNILKAFGELIQ